MKYYLFTFIVLGVFQIILDMKIRKKLDYGYGGYMSETNGFRSYVLTLCMFVAVLIISLFSLSQFHPLIGILLMVLFGIRAAFEWKYIRDTNRHVVSLWLVAISFVVTVLYFILWKVYFQ
ncbi:DUF4181 domain-containing protein [Paenibacillus faecalis]|uniref:DUF4181 domain-containing protein n=1 Tax=Paenibacillus faecalis TaxID=2079532 RepID=UPI000D0F9332